jgi:hypothetical protein
MPRYAYGAKSTVEGCRSIDVLKWHRLGYLNSSRWFSWQWRRDGEITATIQVETKRHRVTLNYRHRSYGDEWSDVSQNVPVDWTPCRFGGERPWFVCTVHKNGRYCGRQVSKLYGGGKLFACRHCYGLAYSSQQESARERGLLKARSIRQRLGGNASLMDAFPDKPRGMHWRTYDRLQRRCEAAESRSLMGVMRFLERHRSRLT